MVRKKVKAILKVSEVLEKLNEIEKHLLDFETENERAHEKIRQSKSDLNGRQ